VPISPQHNIDREDRPEIRNSPKLLRETSIDLCGTISQIEQEIDSLADRLRTWSDGAPVTVLPEHSLV
jgi:hypothetical protein